jgi:hypothetical protein
MTILMSFDHSYNLYDAVSSNSGDTSWSMRQEQRLRTLSIQGVYQTLVAVLALKDPSVTSPVLGL